MDAFFVHGLIELLMLVIVPAMLYIFGIKSVHGMTIIVSGGFIYALVVGVMGHFICTMVYAFFIIGYVVYRADKYIDQKKANAATYEQFKNFIDLDFSDVEELFTNIFGSSETVDTKGSYEKEFKKFYNKYGSQFDADYQRRFSSNNGAGYQGSQNNYRSQRFTQSNTGNTQGQGYSYRKDYSKSTNTNTEEINQKAVANGLRYFAKCMTVDDAKKVYRKYAVKYHPDNPTTGNQEKFIEIDKQYNRFMELFS